MKRILLFLGNFLVSIIFGMDIISYYTGGTNIISNDVNRIFIMWLGFIVSVISCCWFMIEYLDKKNEQ